MEGISQNITNAYRLFCRRELYFHGVKVIGIEPGGYDTALLGDDQTRESLDKMYQASSPHVQRVYGADYADRSQLRD